MKDDFLYNLRKTPPPDFAARLKARLDLQGHARSRARRLRLYTFIGLLLGGAALAFMSPSVRQTTIVFVERLELSIAADASTETRKGPPLSADNIPWGRRTRAGSDAALAVPEETAREAENDAPAVARMSSSTSAAARSAEREQKEPALPGAVSLPQSRPEFTVTGSATLAPYTQTVHERISTARTKIPLRVSVMGADAGLMRLCGTGFLSPPDVVQSTRRMLPHEAEQCTRNRVSLIEMKVGYDAIVLARAANAVPFRLTWWSIYSALGKDVPEPNIGTLIRNPHKTWQEIDPYLSADRIKVIGPPIGSEPFEFFSEQVLVPGCRSTSWIQIRHWRLIPFMCRAVREDGAYFGQSVTEDLLIQQIESDSSLVGLIPYRTFRAAGARLIGSRINKVAPAVEAIIAERYAGSAPIFLYIRKGTVPAAFIREYLSEQAIGPKGYLTEMGLIPLLDSERARQRDEVLPQIKP